MQDKARIGLHVALFYCAVVVFTFGSTFMHEMAHALAWEEEMPRVRFDSDRDSAQAAVGQEQRLHIDGTNYRVMEVDHTTIALYPQAILASGATLGIAPATMLPDHVLGSTFYALDEEHYRSLAAGEDVIGTEESAMPMVVNALLMVPIWVWLWLRPNAFSIAAAWVNAAEWRFNLHHAQEIGIPSALHYMGSTLVMVVTASAIAYLVGRRWNLRRRELPTATTGTA